MFNPLIATLNPQSNGPSYSNTVIGTLAAVDGWAQGCYIWYSEKGTRLGRSPPRPLLVIPNVTAIVPILYDVAVYLPLESKGLSMDKSSFTVKFVQF